MTRKYDSSIFAQDFQALSLFRIVFALWLFVDFLLVNSCCYEDFYGEAGLFPISVHNFTSHISGVAAFLPIIDLAKVTGAVFPYLYPVAILAFGLGYRTRWATAAVFLLHAYLYWRNPYINARIDTLAHLLLLWSLFLPMSRYWSVDSALDPEPRDRKYPAAPFAALKLQIYSVYVFAGLFKVIGEPWMNGDAVRWALSDDIVGGTPIGLFLVQNFPGVLTFVTYATIVFQLVFPLLVFWPWRNEWTRGFALLAAAAMHIAFILCLNIGGFPYLSLAMLILLIPDAWIDRVLARRRERLSRIALYFEPGCAFCQKTALLFREFLSPPAVPVLPASADAEALKLLREHQSWVVKGADGAIYLKWRGVTYLLKQNPIFAPLGYLMGLPLVSWVMERLYDLIGRNRRALGGLTSVFLHFRSERPIGRPAIVLCGFLAAMALAYNTYGILKASRADQASAHWLYNSSLPSRVATILQVKQEWSLFAPIPTHSRRNFQIFAYKDNGSPAGAKELLPGPWYNVRDEGAGVDFQMHRWQKYFTRIKNPNSMKPGEWEALGHYLCRKARQRSPDRADSLRFVEFIMISRPFDQATPATPEQILRRRFSCADGRT